MTTTLDFNTLPSPLRNQIVGMTAHQILVGESGVDVYRLRDDADSVCYLKIAAGAIAAGAGATLFLWKGKETSGGVAIGPGMMAVQGRF